VKVSSILLCAVMVTAGARAQNALHEFEVASIKQNRSGSLNSSSNRIAGERFHANNASLVSLLRAAYSVQEFQIVGYPAWAEIDRFDIDAKMAAGANAREWPLMLQKLLGERFKLELHREERQAAIFTLLVTNGGQKLKPGDPSNCTGSSCGLNATPTEIVGENVTMAQLAARLSRSLGTHVVDGTSLTGTFDFKLTWPSDDRFDGRGASANPAIFTAIQEQLGLRLQAGRGSVETLVVDRVERPVVD
jgi:uncharacterized protein (TIGR03435 family)